MEELTHNLSTLSYTSTNIAPLYPILRRISLHSILYFDEYRSTLSYTSTNILYIHLQNLYEFNEYHS